MKIINNLILLIFTIYIIYFVFSYIPFIFKKKDIITSTKKLNKYLILIPCMNEYDVIKRIVDSINKQSYNKKYFDYVLLINNTTDDSIKLCNENNFNYLKLNNVHNKGDVLRYAFNYYKDSTYIGYLIFDADNVLDKDFIKNINDYYNTYGYNLIQGRRVGLNTTFNTVTGLYEIYYAMQNDAFNELKIKEGLSSTINGTGFFISKEYIKKYGFNTKTLTEDVELTILASLNHEKIGYFDKAITFDEYVSSFKVSIIQRKRWSRGMLDNLKYLKPLLKDLLKNKNINSLDNMCILIGTFMYFPLVINYILLGIYNIYYLLFVLLFTYFVLVIYNLILILRIKIKVKVSSLFTYPLFLFSFFYVQLLSLFKKDYSWKKTKHGVKD